MKQLLLLFFSLPIFATTFVTPEQFGAVGDGITDDHAAFQLAINQSNNSTTTVLLDRKTYRIGQPLILDDFSAIIGQGSEVTTLQFDVILDTPVIKTPSHRLSGAIGNHQSIRLEGFRVQCAGNLNERYEGISMWGVDYPIARDLLITGVSVGHAFLMAQCRFACLGDIRDIRAEDCNFNQPQTGTTSVIHFSGCEDLFVQNLCVIDAQGAAPANQRDAISCVVSKNITISGMRGINVDSLLDAGRNDHCLFEDFYGRNLRQIPVYSNNGNQNCTFRNGRFENSNFAILVLAPEATTGFPVDSYNVFENFEFYEPAAYGAPQVGIDVRAATDHSPTNSRMPHNNIFRDIHFVDPANPPKLTRVIEEDGITGLNAYTKISLDLPNSSQTLSPRVTGPANGANLQGFEEKIGQITDNLGGSALTQKAYNVVLPTTDAVVGVTLSLNTSAAGDSVQYVNSAVRNMNGNSFTIVIATTNGNPFASHISGEIKITYRALVE